MTRQKFIKIMNKAIEKCNNSYEGGYTCNIIDKCVDDTSVCDSSVREKYADVFDFHICTVLCKLMPLDIPLTSKNLKRTRLTCLALFKTVMLESKGYEEL